MKKIPKLIISIIIPQLAGAVGSVFTAASVGTWYQTLEKPALNPPSWVFGPVWTILFFLMGYALFIVWTKEEKDRKKAYAIFGAQFMLNVFWSVFFFGFRNPGAAFLEIIVLWLAIIANIFIFSKISRTSAWLLVPYLFWVTFAAYLNFSIWRLN